MRNLTEISIRIRCYHIDEKKVGEITQQQKGVTDNKIMANERGSIERYQDTITSLSTVNVQAPILDIFSITMITKLHQIHFELHRTIKYNTDQKKKNIRFHKDFISLILRNFCTAYLNVAKI